MKKEKARVYEILIGIVMSIAVVVVFLISSFEMGAYGSWDFYEKEYEKYNVKIKLDMEMDDIMEVTKYMMSYLRGNEEVLSIETTVEGEVQDFFNEQDRFHMEEVQTLFIGGLWMRRISCAIIAVLAFALWKKKSNWKAFLPEVYQKTIAVLGVVVAALAYFIYKNFSEVFVIFHEIFFDNDLWIFDPRTDYMIRMLPEGFFYDIVIRIGTIFILFLAGSIITSILLKKQFDKQK